MDSLLMNMDPTAKEHSRPTLISPGTSKSLNKNGIYVQGLFLLLICVASGKTNKGGKRSFRKLKRLSQVCNDTILLEPRLLLIALQKVL